MSLQSVRDFFAARNLDIPIIELEVSTATVALAAEAHGVEPGRIAKTLSFRLNGGEVIILVTRGDARIDNRKFKEAFGKGKMLAVEEVVELTGHPVGVSARLAWPSRYRYIWMPRCATLTRYSRLPGPFTAQYASPRR
jgi:prolyl-tRNA editing enzyme YbaK/EbsC (Cys-tRNA(Pro) deacylase)